MKRSKIIKAIYIVVGCISLVLGAIGVILPILPTTPFLLLTSYCFVRGSTKFNNWFLSTKLYKNHLENFVKYRVMSIQGELILLILVSTMLICTMYFTNKLSVCIILLVLICIKYSYFIFRVKPVSRKEYIRIKNQIKQEKEIIKNNENIVESENKYGDNKNLSNN